MRLTWRVAALASAGVAVAAAGGAIAATRMLSPKQESQAVVNDAARELGVEPSRLSAALKKALENRVDAAVADGRLTQAEGDAIKQRIESGDIPLFGFGPPHHAFGFRLRGPFGARLDAAASYLGLTRAQLRSQLRSGKTLAQVARERGKSVEGLVDALVAELEKKLDAEVAAGRLTKAEEQQALAHFRARIADFVNGRFPPAFRHGRFGRPFGAPRPFGFRRWH